MSLLSKEPGQTENTDSLFGTESSPVVVISHPTDSLHPHHEVHVYTSEAQLGGEFVRSSSARSAEPSVLQYPDGSEVLFLGLGDSLNTDMIRPGTQNYKDWLETRLERAKRVGTNQPMPVWMQTRASSFQSGASRGRKRAVPHQSYVPSSSTGPSPYGPKSREWSLKPGKPSNTSQSAPESTTEQESSELTVISSRNNLHVYPNAEAYNQDFPCTKAKKNWAHPQVFSIDPGRGGEGSTTYTVFPREGATMEEGLALQSQPRPKGAKPIKSHFGVKRPAWDV